MEYINYYNSPLGKILLSVDNIGLTGLWFEGQKYYAKNLDIEYQEKDMDLFDVVKKWLDSYFKGENIDINFPIHLKGTTFQKEVWNILCTIPYGKTITYGQIAKMIANKQEKQSMSAQAIGGAVGKNPISIIIPCHRVIGSNRNITGYAGGIDKKIKLLELENSEVLLNK